MDCFLILCFMVCWLPFVTTQSTLPLAGNESKNVSLQCMYELKFIANIIYLSYAIYAYFVQWINLLLTSQEVKMFFSKIYIPHQKHMNFSFHPESHHFLCSHWHSRNQLLKHGFFYLLLMLRKWHASIPKTKIPGSVLKIPNSLFLSFYNSPINSTYQLWSIPCTCTELSTLI